MYLLYLDDSGSASNANETHFVLGGFVVHEGNVRKVNVCLERIAARYQGSEDMVELHASEIAGGRSSPWKAIPIKQVRCEILKDVLRVAADDRNGVSVLACAVEKLSLKAGENPVTRAFEDLSERFQLFIQRQRRDDHGLIILDKSAYETSLQQCALDFKILGGRRGISMDRIQEVPLFVNSKASRGIQLADHIAYAVFRRYEHQDLAYYNIIEGALDADAGKIHGLRHITNNPKCTCPYCSQRRMKRRG